MRLATLRTASGTQAALLDGDDLVLLEARDVRAVFDATQIADALGARTGERVRLADADFATLVPNPSKFFCVGLNYRSHILEGGREVPEFPTLFTKFPSTLIGANDDIVLPSNSVKPDWEVELGIVIGKSIRRGSLEDARGAIAGFTVVNDISMRDWQRRTQEWTQGKNFEATTPVGPFLVTLDELDDPFNLEVRCEVDGEVMQQDHTSELVFGPLEIVAYCSQITTLEPGDVIATGTTGGVGDARKPPVYLRPGQVVRTVVVGVGECLNTTVAEIG